MQRSLRMTCLLGSMAIAAVTGCGEPPQEDDLLTVVDVQHGEVVLFPGVQTDLTVGARVTFRDWATASLVVEARVSETLDVADIEPLVSGERAERALAWEQVMAASTGAGLVERLLVGYPSLIREHTFALQVTVPDTLSVRSAFLVAYLAIIEEDEVEGVEQIISIEPLGVESGILNDVAIVGLGGGS